MIRLRIAVGVIGLIFALSVVATGRTSADDHLFCAVDAGGLTTQSNPFTKTSGRSGATVPGQGSPLCGADTTTPAVATDEISPNANPGNGTVRTPPPVGTVVVPGGH
jgi:hypothetical protein